MKKIICPDCEKENDIKNEICEYCGKELYIICPDCGNKELIENERCSNCGLILQKDNYYTSVKVISFLIPYFGLLIYA